MKKFGLSLEKDAGYSKLIVVTERIIAKYKSLKKNVSSNISYVNPEFMPLWKTP